MVLLLGKPAPCPPGARCPVYLGGCCRALQGHPGWTGRSSRPATTRAHPVSRPALLLYGNTSSAASLPPSSPCRPRGFSHPSRGMHSGRRPLLSHPTRPTSPFVALLIWRHLVVVFTRLWSVPGGVGFVPGSHVRSPWFCVRTPRCSVRPMNPPPTFQNCQFWGLRGC